MIGRRRAGKTIFLARLYEMLWQGCVLVDGCLPAKSERRSGVETRMSCRATSGAAHSQFMRIVDELRAGRWPAATIGNSYAELRVDYGGREYLLTALDYPGEVFRKAFMGDSGDPDALELLEAIDRAAAAILLIDPSVVAAGGEEAHEDTFGLTQAAARIRAGSGGADVPIAIVLTKCDVNGAFLREAGGVRDFAAKHFSQLFRSVERTSVFACAAVRSVQNSLGKLVPRVDRVPDNVVEPLRYCFDSMASA
ncbi:MAG: TRAFAC clade GTPase domain-containing protein, partial [bacterium]